MTNGRGNRLLKEGNLLLNEHFFKEFILVVDMNLNIMRKEIFNRIAHMGKQTAESHYS